MFKITDELEFKKAFAINFMAAKEAVDYQNNCTNGWTGHTVAVEDAEYMADRAWDNWVESIGVE